MRDSPIFGSSDEDEVDLGRYVRAREEHLEEEEFLFLEAREAIRKGTIRMTLATAIENCYDGTYLFNEISGELVVIEEKTGEKGCERKMSSRTLIPGDARNPKIMCQMLFGEKQVSESWNIITDKEANDRFLVYWSQLSP